MIGGWWVAALERPLRLEATERRGDVLVVLGAALAPDGTLGPALAERVEEGAAAFRRGLAPAMIVTGALEAEAMRARAVALGVPKAAILLEPTARTTRENALASSALMRAHGFSRALIVTQPFHVRRSVAAFRRVGVEADPLPFRSAVTTARQAAREYVALAVYAARGWLLL